MRHGIPSLGALQAFEAAARHQSFTLAADELSLTNGAVSRSINELEVMVSVPLFRRERQRVVLTESGARYAARVRVHLEHLRRDTSALIESGKEINLDVAIGVTMGAQWFIPRLASFYRECPHIHLHVMGRDQPTFFADSNFDIALYYGRSLWPGLDGRCLIDDDELLPVCAPRLLAGRRLLPLEEIAALPRITLRDIPNAWRDWWLHVGADRSQAPPQQEHRYDMFVMAINAALEGLGVAMLPRLLISRELEQRRLVQVHPLSIAHSEFLYAAYPAHMAESEAFRTFLAWLNAETDRYKAETVKAVRRFGAHSSRYASTRPRKPSQAM